MTNPFFTTPNPAAQKLEALRQLFPQAVEVDDLERIRVNPAAIQLALDPANHDFGYAMHRQGDPQALYLVVETKGYENRARIEGEERLKVDSAKKFFEASKAEGVPVEFVSKINGEKLGSLVAGIFQA
jgi:restriction endonuclease